MPLEPRTGAAAAASVIAESVRARALAVQGSGRPKKKATKASRARGRKAREVRARPPPADSTFLEISCSFYNIRNSHHQGDLAYAMCHHSLHSDRRLSLFDTRR